MFGGSDSARSLGRRAAGPWTEPVERAALDGERDPGIDDFSEDLVVGQAPLNFGGAIGANEPTDGFATMHVGQFVVWAVALWVFGIHAAASGFGANLILTGDAAGVNGAQSEEFLA